MKFRIVNYTVSAALGLLCCAGCHRGAPEAPALLPVEQVGPLLQQSFANADKETQDQVGQYVTALQSNDWPTAFEHLHQLRSNPNLTQEQRFALVRIQQTTVRELNDSAEKGNEKAADAMATYKATK
jgi:hypothetical protein